MEFTNEEIQECVVFTKDLISRDSRPYYLTDSVPEAFDRTKVGKETCGKYLVFFIPKSNRMDYFTVLKLTADTLVVFHRKVQAIGSMASTTTYRRIK